MASAYLGTFWHHFAIFVNYFIWLRITDEGLVPELRIWSILFIKSDLKWCIHLSKSLYVFQQLDCYLQGKVITTSFGHYPYRAMLQVLLKYGRAAKATQLSAMMWDRDVAGSFDDNVNAGQNTGLYNRARFFAESKLVDLQGPIMHDLFQMDRYLLNQTAVTLKFYRSKPEIYLMTNELGSDYVIDIEDMVLKICKVQVSPAIIYSHAQILESRNASYPFTRTEVKMLAIPAGQINVALDQIFQNVRPDRVLVAMVKSRVWRVVTTRHRGTFRTLT